MKNLFNFSIKTKLFLMISVGIVPLVIAVTAIYMINNGLENKTKRISTLLLPGILTAHNILTDLERIRINEYRYCFSNDPKEKHFYEDEMNSGIGNIEHSLRHYPQLITSKYETTLYNSLIEDYKIFLILHKRIMAASSTGQKDSAKSILTSDSRSVYTRRHSLALFRSMICKSRKGRSENAL